MCTSPGSQDRGRVPGEGLQGPRAPVGREVRGHVLPEESCPLVLPVDPSGQGSAPEGPSLPLTSGFGQMVVSRKVKPA